MFHVSIYNTYRDLITISYFISLIQLGLVLWLTVIRIVSYWIFLKAHITLSEFSTGPRTKTSGILVGPEKHLV